MVKKLSIKPTEVFNTSICVRGVREYRLKKKQYLESSGIVTIEEPSGLLITRAIVSGKHNMKDVTDVIKQHVGQVQTPLEIIHIDTGWMNNFTGHDVEPGTQKLLQLEYITNDKTCKERQVCCPDVCCPPDQHRKSRRRHHCCNDIDETQYICLDDVTQPECEKKRRNHCCDEDKPAVPHRHHHCHHHHHHHQKRPMSTRLLFPLYPIRGAYVYPLIDNHEHEHEHDHDHHHHHKCNCRGRCTCRC